MDLNLDATPVITAGLNAAGAIIKLTADELAYLNSPQMIQGRLDVAKQARKDQNASDANSALTTGNVVEVEKDLS